MALDKCVPSLCFVFFSCRIKIESPALRNVVGLTDIVCVDPVPGTQSGATHAVGEGSWTASLVETMHLLSKCLAQCLVLGGRGALEIHLLLFPPEPIDAKDLVEKVGAKQTGGEGRRGRVTRPKVLKKPTRTRGSLIQDNGSQKGQDPSQELLEVWDGPSQLSQGWKGQRWHLGTRTRDAKRMPSTEGHVP